MSKALVSNDCDNLFPICCFPSSVNSQTQNKQGLEEALRGLLWTSWQLTASIPDSTAADQRRSASGVDDHEASPVSENSYYLAATWSFWFMVHIHITNCRVILKYKCLQHGWNNKITQIKHRKGLLFSSLSSSCEVTSGKTAMLLELFMEPIKEPDSQSWLQGLRTSMVQRFKTPRSPTIVLEHQACCLNGPWGYQTESA